jgi:hypothetical protein
LHIAMTVHGVGSGLDEREAFLAAFEQNRLELEFARRCRWLRE